MLEIKVPSKEMYDAETNTFHYVDGGTLVLEHSLISISKWEAKWKKPYLVDEPKTDIEFLSYIKCMTINKQSSDDIYYSLTSIEKQQIIEYINDKMTATWFAKSSDDTPNRSVITSELIYYWMIKAGIPFECDKWHFNRLLTLLRVCGAKETGGKKMSKNEILARNRALNEARRKQLNTKG